MKFPLSIWPCRTFFWLPFIGVYVCFDPSFLLSLLALCLLTFHRSCGPVVLTFFLFTLFLVLLLSALASHLILLVVIPYFRYYMLDKPNARSSHSHPIPRGGGLSFVLVGVLVNTFVLLSGFVTGFASIPLRFLALPLLALPLAVVSFLDDRHNLSALPRYSVQMLTAFFLILVSPLPLSSVALPFILISITAVINFTNFMDGLDGLVAGCMLVAMSSLAISLSAPGYLGTYGFFVQLPNELEPGQGFYG